MAVIISRNQGPTPPPPIAMGENGAKTDASELAQKLPSGEEVQAAVSEAVTPPKVLTPDNARATVESFGGVKARQIADLMPGVVQSLVGPGGEGKTTMAASAIYSEYINKIVILDSGSNAQVIPPPPSGKTIIDVPCPTWGNIDAIADEFLSGGHKDTDLVIFDNVSNAYDVNFNDWHQKYKDGRKAYGMAQSDLTVTTRKFLKAAEGSRRLNVIFIFQESTEDRLLANENTGELEIGPRREIHLSNKAQGLFPSMVPFMAFVAKVKGEKRVADFRGVGTQGKWQAKQVELFKAIPHLLYFATPYPGLGPLFDTLIGQKPFPVAQYKMPVVLTQNQARPKPEAD